MVSHVGDAGGTYSKHGANMLAVENPEAARMNANNYMLYVA
jgi:hypothetical protein